MNQSLKHLIPAIASYIEEKGAYLSKTKLLKLLYLFDVEYYRIHRETFTGFQWKFFHLGPWTGEFDPLLEELEKADVLRGEPSQNPEYESKLLRATEHHSFDHLLPNIKDELILRSILQTWAERRTGEILDYVYFQTEPMERGVRSQPLDFTAIPREAPERYSRSSSGLTGGEIARLRKQFRDRLANSKSLSGARVTVTPPRYDDEYFDALAKLDQGIP